MPLYVTVVSVATGGVSIAARALTLFGNVLSYVMVCLEPHSERSDVAVGGGLMVKVYVAVVFLHCLLTNIASLQTAMH